MLPQIDGCQIVHYSCTNKHIIALVDAQNNRHVELTDENSVPDSPKWLSGLPSCPIQHINGAIVKIDAKTQTPTEIPQDKPIATASTIDKAVTQPRARKPFNSPEVKSSD
jgi:hypothetical protein